ncbi:MULTISPECIES: universal stress protein [unclassified Brachybacterium]|uniref:universal stress protein n=1 Tax=unclassified Brachybacterium TaxID=2623841 RepID=UPI000C7FE258|nr:MULTISPECIES: universal stress protein [unclassified Brachybacterium]PMC75772.1 universal stress protein [Brachybacterium sp. UMB0905]
MTIVVGYSPSGQGRAALRAALRQQRRTGEVLAIASHRYDDPEIGMTSASEQQIREALAAEGAAAAEVMIRSCSEQDIGEFVLALAEEVSASLVVFGLRRKSRIGKLNLGASARRIVLGARCPVLTVKAEPAA